MEKVKLSYRGTEIEIYDSFQPARLENESREEYLLRRKVISDLEKARKKARNYIHISNMLIPATTPDGKVLMNRQTKKPTFIGVSKGLTYIKKDEEGRS